MNNEGVQPIRELRWSRSLSYTDSGSYLCRAENDNGTDNATLDLLVRCELVFRAGLRVAIGQHSCRMGTDTQTDRQTDTQTDTQQTLRQTLRQMGG